MLASDSADNGFEKIGICCFSAIKLSMQHLKEKKQRLVDLESK